jgi:hypothetical protein
VPAVAPVQVRDVCLSADCVSVCLLAEREHVSETDELDTDARAWTCVLACQPAREVRHDTTYHSHQMCMGAPPTGVARRFVICDERTRQLVYCTSAAKVRCTRVEYFVGCVWNASECEHSHPTAPLEAVGGVAPSAQSCQFGVRGTPRTFI